MNQDNPTKSSQWQRNARRIARVLRAMGINSRQELVARYDKRTDYQDIKGIGPVLGKQLWQMMWDLTRTEEWEAATGMPWGGEGADGRK